MAKAPLAVLMNEVAWEVPLDSVLRLYLEIVLVYYFRSSGVDKLTHLFESLGLLIFVSDHAPL